MGHIDLERTPWQKPRAQGITIPTEIGSIASQYFDRAYADRVFSRLFCAQPDFSPLVCAIEPGWRNMPLFLPTVERTVAKLDANSVVFTALSKLLSEGGRDWLPDPAPGWIETVVNARKSDVQFWHRHGEDTVALLKLVVATHEGPCRMRSAVGLSASQIT